MSKSMTKRLLENAEAAFGPYFEDESDGGAPAGEQPSVPPADAPTGATSPGRFSGTLSIAGGRVLLTSGGIQAEVLVADTPPPPGALADERQRTASLFGPFDGRSVRLRGEQRNGYILRAGPEADGDGRGAGAGGGLRTGARLDESARRSFARVAEAISSHRDELYHPGVIAVRPGYRFTDGLITDEPAIVVVVERKLEQSSIAQGNRIPRSIDGIPVDVAPATPLEQLQHRASHAAVRAAESSGRDAAGNFERAAQALSGRIAEEESFALPFSAELRAERSEGFAETLEALSDIAYEPPPGVHLDEVTGAMTVVCHVSPDAGWPTLKGELFDRVSDRMTIAMYDFTAPHILRGLRSAMTRAGGNLQLILGPGASLGSGTKEDDLPEPTIISRLERALRRRFSNVWAVVRGSARVFANSYHIKVAVRDGRSFWLSSGNWQSSNQPELDPLGADANDRTILKTYNREWHVVVHHPGLADTFEKFIEWDIAHGSRTEAALEAFEEMPEFFVPEPVTSEALEADFVPRYFAPARLNYTPAQPLRVQPLLTPDNYAKKILPLIRSAREKLYFQNQSLSILENNQPEFDALVDALRDKSLDPDIDCRIILRGEFNARKMLEAMQARGFDTSKVRWQDGCHTKGIVIDSRIAVVSSHNWTNSGTLYNRDAGLVFHDPRVARYYEDIFLYDWENLARRRIRTEESAPILAEPGAATPPRMMRVSLSELLDD